MTEERVKELTEQIDKELKKKIKRERAGILTIGDFEKMLRNVMSNGENSKMEVRVFTEVGNEPYEIADNKFVITPSGKKLFIKGKTWLVTDGWGWALEFESNPLSSKDLIGMYRVRPEKLADAVMLYQEIGKL